MWTTSCGEMVQSSTKSHTARSAATTSGPDSGEVHHLKGGGDLNVTPAPGVLKRSCRALCGSCRDGRYTAARRDARHPVRGPACRVGVPLGVRRGDHG